MPDDPEVDVQIIQAAYAERIREAFKVFAENLSMGQNQANTRERFIRSIELTRKARDMALSAMQEVGMVAPTTSGARVNATAGQGQALTAAEQAVVDSVLAGTTGQKPPAVRR